MVGVGKLSDWFAHNKLSLNYLKTEIINFSRSSKIDNELTIRIDGKPIREVEETKFLGVHLDKSCSWRKHINTVITKMSQTVGVIGRARKFMDTPQLTLLYNTMVLPHIQYCLINWGNFKEDRNLKLRDRILRLQKCFLRMIYGTHRLSHTDPLFAHANTLKLDDLFQQSIRCFSYKIANHMMPTRMASLGSRVQHTHHTRGSQSNLTVNSSNHRSIKYIAPYNWNRLPLSLKQSPSISSFKVNSKKALLKPYSAFVCNTKKCHSCKPPPTDSPNPQ